jgi:hypothetical protein
MTSAPLQLAPRLDVTLDCTSQSRAIAVFSCACSPWALHGYLPTDAQHAPHLTAAGAILDERGLLRRGSLGPDRGGAPGCSSPVGCAAAQAAPAAAAGEQIVQAEAGWQQAGAQAATRALSRSASAAGRGSGAALRELTKEFKVGRGFC